VTLCPPLLFVIAMEALSRMMSVVVNKGFIFGFLVGVRNDDSLFVSHLLFVNDTLIFFEGEPNNLWYLRRVPFCFEAVLGLKINWPNLN
jgi:hypothetical protein